MGGTRMRRMTLLMKDELKEALDEMARRSYRDPRNQLLLILRKEAVEHGLLPADEPEGGRTSAPEAGNAR